MSKTVFIYCLFADAFVCMLIPSLNVTVYTWFVDYPMQLCERRSLRVLWAMLRRSPACDY